MAKWLITWSLKNSCFLPKMVIWSFLGENSYFLTFNFSLIKPNCHLYTSKLCNLGGLGRLKGAKKVQKKHTEIQKSGKNTLFWHVFGNFSKSQWEIFMKTWSNVRFDVPVSLAQSVLMSNFGGTYPEKNRGVRTDLPAYISLWAPRSSVWSITAVATVWSWTRIFIRQEKEWVVPSKMPQHLWKIPNPCCTSDGPPFEGASLGEFIRPNPPISPQ